MNALKSKPIFVFCVLHVFGINAFGEMYVTLLIGGFHPKNVQKKEKRKNIYNVYNLAICLKI
jgi:hypothetical protein